LYSTPNIIVINSSKMRWAGHVARMGALRNSYKILIGLLERKRLVGGRRRRWKDNIRIDLREVGWEGVDWVRLDQFSGL
jgi:hypothetical protein